jgi:hypothetical protein
LIRKLCLAAAALLASQAAAQVPPPPRLLVVISVDRLSSGLFDEYRPQFTGGLAELASGTVFRNGSEAQAPVALGDLMKQQWAGSRNVSVSGKTAAPGIVSGNNVDQRWSWTGTKFETDLAAASVPRVVPRANAAIAAALAQPRPALEPTPFCLSTASQSRTGQLGRAAGDAAALRNSPELDGDTLALAAGLTDEMQLGKRAAPDLLSVNLSATSNVAETYGSESEQMCLQLTELDREIGDFLSLLDSRGIDYAVTLTGSGQGGVPILFWRPGFRGATVNEPATIADVTRTLAALIELPLSAGSVTDRCLEGTPAFCPR